MPKAKQTGAQGERIAQRFLRRQGYAILETNWSSLVGELDIIAEKDGQLIFVEVKARRGTDTEAALANITRAKRERMQKAVYQYLDQRELDWECAWRIDVIAVAFARDGAAQIAHVEDAFDW